MKHLTLFTAVILCSFGMAAQQFEWALGFGSTPSQGDDAFDLAVAPNGDVVVVGELRDSADMDPGPGTFWLTGDGAFSGFVARYDANGNFIWAFEITSSLVSGVVRVKGVDIDPRTGNIFITGDYAGVVDINPNGAPALLPHDQGFGDIFNAAYSPAGMLIWGHAVGETGEDRGEDIRVDTILDQVWITGTYEDDPDFDPGAGVDSSDALGQTGCFVTRVGTGGSYISTTFLKGNDDIFGVGVTSDASGNVYVTGHFAKTINFDPNASQTLTASGFADAFIASYNPAGAYRWAYQFGSTGVDLGKDIDCAPDGSIRAIGEFQGTIDMDPGAGVANIGGGGGTTRGYTVSLNPNGTYNWAFGLDISAHEGVAVDDQSNTYITGSFSGTRDFDPGAGTFNMTRISSSADIYIASYDPLGQFRWAVQQGISSSQRGRAVATWMSNTVLACGYFRGSPDMNPHAGVATISSQGFDDGFVTKFSTCPPTPTAIVVNHAICDGDSLLLAGMYRKTAGSYYDTFTSSVGCDSIMQHDLAILQHSQANLTPEICDGDSLFAQGAWRKTSGTYYDTIPAANGCDSVIVTMLTVHPNSSATANAEICDGDSIMLGGAWQKTAGVYHDTIPNANGCDSAIATTLVVKPVATTTTNAAICDGDSMMLGGAWRKSSGTYYDTLTAANGCDSIITTNLTVNAHSSASANAEICEGDSMMLGGDWQTTGGNYVDTLTAANGCDSVVTTTLTVLAKTSRSDSAYICEGDTIVIAGQPRTTAGVYHDTLTSGNGCDSIISTTLFVHIVPQDTITREGDSLRISATFASYQWFLNGMAISGATSNAIALQGSGTYRVVATDANGCAVMPEYTDGPLNAEFRIYPVPSNSQVTVESPIDFVVSVTVYNDLGQLVREYVNAVPEALTVIDLSQQPAGVYLFQVFFVSGEDGTYKVVKF